MKPVYFPFTHISEDILKKISVFFRPLTVLLPSGLNISGDMEKWVESGLLEMRLPAGDDDDRLQAMLKDYRVWANLHQRGQKAYLNHLMDEIPFFNDTSMSQIVKDIKENPQDGGFRNCPDPLFSAKAFLLIAQEFDRQQCEVNQGVQSFEKKEHDLMKNLKGENDDGDVGPLSDATPWADNAMNYMVEERLRVWARLFFSNISLDDQEITALFITGSSLTSEYLLEKFSDAERIFEFDSFPISNLKNDKTKGWRKHLIDTLDNLAKSRWASSSNVVVQGPDRKGCGEKMALSLDIIPETSPIDFVSSLFPSNPNGMAENSIEPEFNHTIIGHLVL